MRTVEPITTEIVIEDYASIREALMNSSLSRTFDKRSYEQGNVREGVVSIMHGKAQRDRRRLENLQFRAAELQLYEQELFPPIVESMVHEVAAAGEADLFSLGEHLSIVLAARRAGFDLDLDDRQAHDDMIAYVDQFSQASAIIDANDPDAIRTSVKEAHAGFHRQFGEPSIQRRLRSLDAFQRGDIEERDLPHDILTSLLRHRDDSDLGLSDEIVIIREAGTYLQGGTHTSAQTLVNAIDLLFDARVARPEYWDRVKTDQAFAQRCMHETLRLRPTTPKVKRRAEEATVVGGIEIPMGALVILDLVKANLDQAIFGADSSEFNPDRELPSRIALWGLSFGHGSHICPGRKVAGGIQHPPAGAPVSGEHLYGLVALMIQAVVQRDPERHPERPQSRDDRTARFTRWSEYWMIFNKPTQPGSEP